MDFLPSWLGNVSPQAAVLVGVLWGTRELFGFTRALVKDLRGPGQNADTVVEVKLILDALQKVGEHIEESTKLLQAFGHELKELRSEVKDLRDRQSRP